MSENAITVTAEDAGTTVAGILRRLMPGESWTRVRRIVEGRRVHISGQVCLDPARRLQAGETIEVLASALPSASNRQPLTVRYVDQHVVVVEKPAGISTVRHPTERDWSKRRRELSPTLEDLVTERLSRSQGGKPARLRIVQRLDKETSGLVVFARSVAAERGLGGQFRAHTVTRRYVAVIAGRLPPQTIASRLVRDRGDGRRGSTKLPGVGKEAVTQVAVLERIGDYTLLSCRLKTGRTHQIRIHLAELGHPICGERVYNRAVSGEVREDKSSAPRLALHASELGFLHPVTGQPMHWSMPLPRDLEAFVNSLRAADSAKT